ncbi:MAG: aminotransferase class V-fold PLP-dependent enzyme, partial [bacterium]
MKRRSFFQKLTGSLLLLPAAKLSAKTVIATPFSTISPQASNYWQLIRQSFPLTRERIYFNTGGLGPSPYQVLEAVDRKRLELETICETGHKYHEIAREKVAAFVGAKPQEIAFTRNATEGMNFVAHGLRLKAVDEVITTTHEHPGGALPWLAVAKQSGVKLKLIEPVHDDPDEMQKRLKSQIGCRTRVMMLSHVPCTLGSVFQVRQLCEMAKKHGLITVLDGAQAVGQIPVNLHEIGCDFYVASGHKWLLGPKGSGFIYISEEAREFFHPTFVGAYSDREYDLNALKLTLRKDAIVTEYGT